LFIQPPFPAVKQFLSVADVPDIHALVAEASAYKASPLKDAHLGTGKRMGLIFLNPSMRTRLSTQLAARNLGIEPIVFDIGKDGWSLELEDGAVMNGNTVEHIRDAAPILGSYFDVIGIRTFPSLKDREKDYSECLLTQLVRHSGVPVISLESSTLHPLQSLADLLTIHEHWTKPRRPKIVLTWAPHIKPLPQCVANSFAEWINAWGEADFTITHPPGYALHTKFTAGATIEHDQQAALKGADFVYVKNWSAYEDYGSMPEVSTNWMLNDEKLAITNKTKVMHCLPVRRNVELSDEVLDSSASIVTQQASNRIWAAQAVLSSILKAV
jgi:N-succinyl-L-ornithine transcarbamylase